MNIEDIKVGETYFVNVKVTATSPNRFVCQPILRGCTMSDFAPNYFNFAEAEAFYKSIPETTPPKYDPCRPFKKGDIVEPVACNGRAPLYLRKYIGTKQVVECDEDINGIVGIVGDVEAVSAAFLKLVTPIEELEPYSVETCQYGYTVNKGELILATYNDETHPHAKAAAAAERDSLNAEYRKGQK